jgi:DnaJ-class molecular chaperone
MKGVEVQMREPCAACEGSGKEPLPAGQFTPTGERERKCRRCDGTGAGEPTGWMPIGDFYEQHPAPE